MNKISKEFTVDDWVDGTQKISYIRINLSDDDHTENFEVNTLSEALIKIKYLQQQYYQILERSKSLEEQLYESQCQIRALHASNLMKSENSGRGEEVEAETELKSIQEEINENASHNPEDYQSLTKQNYYQRKLIEDLMCKLQNMHHRVEYYKEDVTELKTQYEQEKITLQIEKNNQLIIQEQNQEALQTIQRLQEEIDELKKKMLIKKKKSAKMRTKIVIEKSQYQVDAESFMLESKFNNQIIGLQKKYSEEILEIQKRNQSVVENLGSCMKKRMDELRNFYEYRINSMIQEYSFEEARFHSKIQLLKEEIRTHLQINDDLEKKIKCTDTRFKLDRQKTMQAENTIQNLNSLLNKMSLDFVKNTAHSEKEIECLLARTEELANDLKGQYDLQQRIAEKQHQDALKTLKEEYAKKLNKINEEFKQSEKKMLVKDQSEYNALLQEITRIEKEKTEIEMQTEARVQEVLLEAKEVTYK